VKAICDGLRRQCRIVPTLLILLGLFAAACATAPDVVGRWREVGRTATLDLQADGRFEAVDNEGLAVRGAYTLAPDGRARFTIVDQDRVVDVVHLTLTVQGDEMTVRPTDGTDVEHYRRTP
jgi:hypothetical protein